MKTLIVAALAASVVYIIAKSWKVLFAVALVFMVAHH